MSEHRVKRPYDSRLRAEKALGTRRRIRAAAERLFLRDGYLRTSMKVIAAEAGVAERTLYLAFPTKAALLNEVIRVTVRGHDSDEPLASGAAYQRVLEAPPGELLARFATTNATLMSRTARVLALGETAAAADPALAEFRHRGHEAIRSDMRGVAAALERRGELAPHVSVDEAADALFAVATNETLYLRLVDECGWSDSDYAQLIEDLLRGALQRDRP